MVDLDTPIDQVTLAFCDVETTGLSPSRGDRVCEVAVLRCRGLEVEGSFAHLVNPRRPSSSGAYAVHHIAETELLQAPPFIEVAPQLLRLLEGAVFVGHNAPFDLDFITAELRRVGMPVPQLLALDTLLLARKTFDLSTESNKLRESYGKNSLLGQSCLQARKLVEAGVPFITINSKKWDTHKKHFESMQTMLPDLDRAISTLLTDLDQRGLLESTIVWVGGEFGRGPKIQQDAPWNGGRSHHGKAFSHLVAGGGFRGGHVVGTTDNRGIEVIDRKIYPWDLHASMYKLMGINYKDTLPHPAGRLAYISPLAAGNIETGGVLSEII